MKVKVISVFRDKFTSQLYSPDELIEIEDEDRVENLVNLKLVEPIEKKKEVKISLFEKEFEKKVLIDVLKSIGMQVSGNMKEETLLAKVAELDEETTAKLKEALSIE